MTEPYYADETVTLYHGKALDVLRGMESGSVDCVVTSPPYYGLRDYGVEGQIGLEATPAEYVHTLVAVFAEARRVLADDGVLWLNLADSYSTRKIVRDSSHQPGFHPDRLDHETIGKTWRENAADGHARMPGDYGVPEKNLIGIPWRTAFALQDDGWILRNDCIWHKQNAMPESVTDRLSCKHEYLFMFSKSRRYWFDLDPIREPLAYPEAADGSRVFGGSNKAGVGVVGSSERRHGRRYGRAPQNLTPRHQAATDNTGWKDHEPEPHPKGRNPGDVWAINTRPFPDAHFAVYPVEIPRRCIAAGCKPGGVVLDPFSGSGTTGLAAGRLGRSYVGIDLNSDYLDLSLRTRLRQCSMVEVGDD